MPSANFELILTFFVGLTMLAMLTQAVFIVALFLSAKKSFESLRAEFNEFREGAAPVVNSARSFLEKVAPKIEPITHDMFATVENAKAISGDLTKVSREVSELMEKVRAQANGLEASTVEVLERVKFQLNRVDSMVTGVLDSADRAGQFLQQTVTVPARQLTGILAAAKAIVDSLRHFEPARRARPVNDHESFI
jgi:methyl-accepting chemotaxis protein